MVAKRDINQLAKTIVATTTGEIPPVPANERNKNPHAVALGRLDGLKGEVAKARKLSAKQSEDIAQRAAQTRYSKNK